MDATSLARCGLVFVAALCMSPSHHLLLTAISFPSMRDARDQKSYGSIASDSDNGSHVDHPSSTIPRIAVTPAPVRRQSSIQIYLSFIDEFRKCTGGWQILVIGMLLSLGIGSVIGIIPQVTTQRYAEQLFGYDGPPCASFLEHKPAACIIGASSAQTSASYCSMAKNTLSLLCNPMAGSFSDRHGRRGTLPQQCRSSTAVCGALTKPERLLRLLSYVGILIFALFVIMSSPAALFLIQVYPAIHPGWYFVVDSFTGTLSFFSIAYSMLSDSMPPRHRAASFGMFFGAFFSGIAIGPLLAVILDHIQVAFVSFLVRVVALVFCVVALPETLRPEIAAGNIEKQRVAPIQAVCTVLRPLYEMSILCRNKTLVLLTIGTFLSKLVFSADVTLFFYYVENNLGVRDHDVAGMLFLTGCVGMLVQVCHTIVPGLGTHKYQRIIS